MTLSLIQLAGKVMSFTAAALRGVERPADSEKLQSGSVYLGFIPLCNILLALFIAASDIWNTTY
jgi:hypothetical protein